MKYLPYADLELHFIFKYVFFILNFLHLLLGDFKFYIIYDDSSGKLYIRLSDINNYFTLKSAYNVKQRFNLNCVPFSQIVNDYPLHSINRNTYFLNIYECLYVFASVSNESASLDWTNIISKFYKYLFSGK